MSKERLEVIKEAANNTDDNMFYIPSSDVYFLIKKAERAQKNAEDLGDMDKQLYSTQQRVQELEKYQKAMLKDAETLVNKNKRYREVLKHYAENSPLGGLAEDVLESGSDE